MSTDEELIPATERKLPIDVSGNYQPIHLEDTAGAIFLGIFAVISLVGWIRSEARYRKLINISEKSVE